MHWSMCIKKIRKVSFSCLWLCLIYIFLTEYVNRREFRDRLTTKGFLIAVFIGNLILACYTGALAYIGADTGLSMHYLLGIHLVKRVICSIICNKYYSNGWFGVGIAMFAIPVAIDLM